MGRARYHLVSGRWGEILGGRVTVQPEFLEYQAGAARGEGAEGEKWAEIATEN